MSQRIRDLSAGQRTLITTLAAEQPLTSGEIIAHIDGIHAHYQIASAIGRCRSERLITDTGDGWALTHIGRDVAITLTDGSEDVRAYAPRDGRMVILDGGEHRGYNPDEYDGAEERTCPLCGESCSRLPGHIRSECDAADDGSGELIPDGGTTTDSDSATPDQPDPVNVNGHLVALDTLTCHHCGVYKQTLGRFASHSCSGDGAGQTPAQRCLASIHRWLGGIDGTDLSAEAHEHLEWARGASGQLAAGPVWATDAESLAVHFGALREEVAGEDAELVRHCQQLLEGIRQFAGGEGK